MTPRARIGRPPVLTRDAIARAVLDVGFPALTFAAVRERLSVGQTTLYRYAKDRDELVRIALDRAIAQTDWPPLDGTWRQIMERYALALWHVWASHPGSANEAARGIVPPSMMRLADDLCAVLLRRGFTPQAAVLACDVVFDMVTDNRRGVEHLDSGPGTVWENPHRGWDEEEPPPDAGHATAAERAAVHAAMREATSAAPIDWFTGKLRVVLDGVAHSLAPSGEG